MLIQRDDTYVLIGGVSVNEFKPFGLVFIVVVEVLLSGAVTTGDKAKREFLNVEEIDDVVDKEDDEY